MGKNKILQMFIIVALLFGFSFNSTKVFAGVPGSIVIQDPYNLEYEVEHALTKQDSKFVLLKNRIDDGETRIATYKPNGKVYYEVINKNANSRIRSTFNLNNLKYKVQYRPCNEKKWVKCSKSNLPKIYSDYTSPDSFIVNIAKEVRKASSISTRKSLAKLYLIHNHTNLKISSKSIIEKLAGGVTNYSTIEEYSVDGVRYSKKYTYQFEERNGKLLFYGFKISDVDNPDSTSYRSTVVVYTE